MCRLFFIYFYITVEAAVEFIFNLICAVPLSLRVENLNIKERVCECKFVHFLHLVYYRRSAPADNDMDDLLGVSLISEVVPIKFIST